MPKLSYSEYEEYLKLKDELGVLKMQNKAAKNTLLAEKNELELLLEKERERVKELEKKLSEVTKQEVKQRGRRKKVE